MIPKLIFFILVLLRLAPVVHSCLAEKYIIGEINEKRLLTLVGSKNAVYHPFFNLLLPSTQSMLKSFLIYMKTKLKPVYHKGKL